MLPQAKEHQGLPATTKSQEKALSSFSPESQEGTDPAN